MININKFRNDLKQYLLKYSANDEDDFAEYFVNLYYNVFMKGITQYGNKPLVVNSSGFKTILKQHLNLAKINNRNIYNIIGKAINIGVKIFWTSAIFENLKPPVGSVSVVKNTIIYPGDINFVMPESNNNVNIFVNSITNELIKHIKTLKGENISLVNTGTSLIPMPFYWNGLF